MALTRLYDTTPAARDLAATAKGILVFPDISRENYNYTLGLQAGNGALIEGGRLVGYYATTSITYGLQAGVLPFGYALFLMTDSARGRLEQSGGWRGALWFLGRKSRGARNSSACIRARFRFRMMWISR